MEVVRVGVVAPAYINVALWVAQRQGFFHDEGLRVEQHVIGSTTGVTTALRAGTVDLAMTAPEGCIADAMSGGSLRLVAGLANKPPLSLIGLARHQRITDLRGGRIGTSSLHEGTRHLLEIMLADAALTYPRDYQFVLEGSHVARWQALQAGTIDAAAQLVPYNYLAEDAGFTNLGDLDSSIPHFAFSAVCADTATDTATDTGRLVRFLRALFGATLWFYDHVDEAAAIAAAETSMRCEYARRACRELAAKEVLAKDLRITPKAFAATADGGRGAGEGAGGAALDYSYLDEAVR